MKNINQYIGYLLAALGAIACFLFYQLKYPYHLFHREQVSLFLYTEEAVRELLGQAGGLALLGDEFLTQFFYFVGGGATVLTLLLLFLAIACYRSLRKITPQWSALLITSVVCLWEFGRICLVNYPLASTLSMLGGFLFFLLYPKGYKFYPRLTCGLFLLIFGHLLIGYGIWITAILLILQELKKRSWITAGALALTLVCLPFQPMKGVKAWGKPNFYLEQLLAMDTHAYFGQWEKVNEKAQTDLRSDLGTYYFNLSNAMKQQLPEHLMKYYQPSTRGLFLPVDPSGNYLSFMAASELWFQLGDMTLAEHSAILGMISTANHRSSRMLKRMAEINLVNGDEEAALKYLRILQKTWKHREWAEQRMPGHTHPQIQKWLENKRKNLASADTLRSAGDARLSLCHLLDSNPDNLLAYQYLLCYDLLAKNIHAFVQDFNPEKGINSRLYQEALLIYLANQHAAFDPEVFQRYGFTPELLQEFQDYTQRYEQTNGNPAALADKYSKTYWFYFHFAKTQS